MYGPHKINEDIAVPRSMIPEMVKRIRALSEATGLTIASFGHAGDGNMHPDILTDRENPKWFARAEKALEEIISLALDLGGVISGEHGIGLEKKKYMNRSMDPAAILMSKTVKDFFDPAGILNPEKIWN